MNEEQYRLAVYRKGSEPEFFYSKDPEKLKRRAVKLLNKPVPWATEPARSVLEVKVGSLGKNNSLWRTLEIIPADKRE